MQKESMIQAKKLQRQGFSNEWIYRAISHKPHSEWQKYGYGLLWVAHYQNQITNLLAAERNQLGDIDVENLTWDSLISEEENSPDTQIDQAEELSIDDLFAKYGVENG